MKEFVTKYNVIGITLYALFGFVLSLAGVGVMEKPIEFITLLAILIVVDISSHTNGLNKGVEIAKDVYGIK